MDKIGSGLLAAFVATLLMAVILSIKSAIGVFPDVDVIQLLMTMAASHLGTTEHMAVGWAVHFFVGVLLWGPIFSIVEPRLPGGDFWLRGISFGLCAWVGMMVIVMPLAGVGFFGFNIGISAPILVLFMHVIFGALLGGIYGSFLRGRASTTR